VRRGDKCFTIRLFVMNLITSLVKSVMLNYFSADCFSEETEYLYSNFVSMQIFSSPCFTG